MSAPASSSKPLQSTNKAEQLQCNGCDKKFASVKPCTCTHKCGSIFCSQKCLRKSSKKHIPLCRKILALHEFINVNREMLTLYCGYLKTEPEGNWEGVCLKLNPSFEEPIKAEPLSGEELDERMKSLPSTQFSMRAKLYQYSFMILLTDNDGASHQFHEMDLVSGGEMQIVTSAGAWLPRATDFMLTLKEIEHNQYQRRYCAIGQAQKLTLKMALATRLISSEVKLYKAGFDVSTERTQDPTIIRVKLHFDSYGQWKYFVEAGIINPEDNTPTEGFKAVMEKKKQEDALAEGLKAETDKNNRDD